MSTPTAKKLPITRTTRDGVSLMFRRGISHRHSKGKVRLVSTEKTITKEDYKKVGVNFALIYDHALCKRFAPLLNIIRKECNPKNERFYVTIDKLSPSYVAVPFVPKQRATDPASPSAASVTAAVVKTKAARKPGATVAAAAPTATAAKRGKKAAEPATPAPAAAATKAKNKNAAAKVGKK